jgi:phospholipid transport system substrate-binding protein
MRNRTRIVQIFLLLGLLLLPLSPAWAQGPQETLQQHIDMVLEIVRARDYLESGPTERTQMLLHATKDIFDKQEVAQRVLAVHWRRFSPQQRTEFIDLFTEFLQRNYAQRIGAYTYSDERVDFTEVVMVDSRAIVKTFIVAPDKRIPVDYAMLEKDGKWLVYDARIEGVSLVQNYRSQFNDILIRRSPEELLQMLRERVEQG